jgi:hypothetical protein
MLFTSMFLDVDLWHLGGNMLFLYVFDDNVEDTTSLRHVNPRTYKENGNCLLDTHWRLYSWPIFRLGLERKEEASSCSLTR